MLVALLAVGFNTVTQRIVRNAWLPAVPEAVPASYAPCSDTELVDMVTLVVTVKDTCGQAQYILDRLAKTYPKDMRLIYAYPDIRGCRNISVRRVTGRWMIWA